MNKLLGLLMACVFGAFTSYACKELNIPFGIMMLLCLCIGYTCGEIYG